MGSTALHIAAEFGNTEIVKLLLKIDSEIIKVLNYEHNTALMLAAKFGHVEISKILVFKTHPEHFNLLNWHSLKTEIQKNVSDEKIKIQILNIILGAKIANNLYNCQALDNEIDELIYYKKDLNDMIIDIFKNILINYGCNYSNLSAYKHFIKEKYNSPHYTNLKMEIENLLEELEDKILIIEADLIAQCEGRSVLSLINF